MCAEGKGCGKRWVRWELRGTGTASGHPGCGLDVRRWTVLLYQTFDTFFQFVLSTYPLLLYQVLSSFKFLSHYHTFIIFSSVVIYSLFTLSMHPINVPALHPIRYNSHSRLIKRTPPAPIHLSNSTGVFRHHAIQVWGNRVMAGSFL